MKTYNLFPNYLIEDKAELTSEIVSSLKNDIDEVKNSALYEETTYGWTSNRKTGLPQNSLKSLSLLAGNYFSKDIRKLFDTRNLNIDIIEPYLISIKPGAYYPLDVNIRRWFNGCIWLQTSNKGSHLYFKDFNARQFLGPDCVDREFYASPVKHKMCFWPSNVPSGFTTNKSQIDNIIMCFTFRAPVKI